MQKITWVKLIAKNLDLRSENGIIDGVCSGNEISKTKSQVDFCAKLSKYKNRIRPNLAKFKSLAELSFGPRYQFAATIFAFVKFRKTFIKIPILYYFHSTYHIWVKTDGLSYVIDKILS